MITEERLKYYEKEVRLTSLLETAFLMQKSGKATGISSSGLTTIQYKINNGTYATPVFPFTYTAGDVIYFSYSYTNQISVSGNLILSGKDN